MRQPKCHFSWPARAGARRVGAVSHQRSFEQSDGPRVDRFCGAINVCVDSQTLDEPIVKTGRRGRDVLIIEAVIAEHHRQRSGYLIDAGGCQPGRRG
nr:hypothetical protein [Mycobacterium gordonae]